MWQMINLKKLIPILLLPVVSVHAQKIKSMEFNSQKITDILIALGEESGRSIIPDETVEGTASFFFAESDAEEILENFLNSNGLYCEEKKGILYISKVFCSVKDSLVSLKCSSCSIEKIVEILSRKTGMTILHDRMADEKISIDVRDFTIEQILDILTAKLPDCSVIKKDGWFYLKKETNRETANLNRSIKKNNGLFSINVDSITIQEAVKLLFSIEGKEYSCLSQTNDKIENLYFTDKTFEECLNLILEKASLDYTVKNNIYYIIEQSRKNTQQRFKEIQVVPLKHISVQQAVSLLPPELSSPQVFKGDPDSGNIILTGTNEENKAVIEFIEKIDAEENSILSRKHYLKHTEAKNLLSLLSQETAAKCRLIEDENALLITATPAAVNEIINVINTLDEKKSAVPVTLRYLKSEELLKKLPPSIRKDTVCYSLFPNLIFFKGSKENLEMFKKELELIDRPVPQLKYKLLVVQYTDGTARSSGTSLSFSKNNSKNSFSYEGELSNIMSLSFNIISAFGFQAAANLNEKIASNTASIFTDTVLTALSGEEVRFQNTDTYRYIEYEYGTTASGSTTSGITQQITSGLIVNLKGWTSGDDMITMNINATVSKQNSESSAKTAIPSTSERVVNTQVRTPSGKPVVISGLIKEDETLQETRTPVLGRIPLINRFFTHKNMTKEKTEIVIYIIPHLIKDGNEKIPDCREIYKMTMEKA